MYTDRQTQANRQTNTGKQTDKQTERLYNSLAHALGGLIITKLRWQAVRLGVIH